MLSAWNRRVICIKGNVMLFNSLWFCLYCMYFFKGFRGRPQKYRSACERGRTCIFTGYPPLLQRQSGLLCTCIIEAPNKTHCGQLVIQLTSSVIELSGFGCTYLIECSMAPLKFCNFLICPTSFHAHMHIFYHTCSVHS